MEQATGVARPPGGKLVNRITTKNSPGTYSISVNADLASDIENIADGIFSPLEGFLLQQDFEAVVSKGRLTNGIPWTVPIVLDVDNQTATKMKDAREVSLKNSQGEDFAILHVEDVYTFDKNTTAKSVYGTTDPTHPGVTKTMSMQDFLIGGKIDYIKRPSDAIAGIVLSTNVKVITANDSNHLHHCEYTGNPASNKR